METQVQSPIEGRDTKTTGCYVYCVVPYAYEVCPDVTGIEGCRVYAIVHRGLGAIVHDCAAQPYRSEDAHLVASWVMAHHRVVEAAWERWGTVLPLTFNTIVKGADERSAVENTRMWLDVEHEWLRARLSSLTGKVEYGIQVFWDTETIARTVAVTNSEVRKLQEEIESKPRGLAYMYRQKLENLLRKGLEARAAEEFKDLYARISRCTANVRAEKVKNGELGRQMLVNLSCLVCQDRFPDLQAELDQVNNTEGFSVRLVGPLPPYSFC
ncbi:MAG: GvpL/GvpF family gas vesicle protein [Chloroflexota bacterium]